MSASNTLTADQQAAIAQTTYGNQVSIKTVAVNPIKDNEVQLSFVDQSGNAVGSLKLTKGTTDKKAIDTIKAASGSDPTSSDATTIQKAYAALLAKAGVKGYTTDGLTTDQTAANLKAMQGATYGQNIQLVVAKMPTKQLISSVQFFDKANTDKALGYVENANGKRDEDTNFGAALAKDNNLNGYAGDTVSVDSFNKALNDQGLQTVYYAAKREGLPLFYFAGDHLSKDSFDGTSGGMFSTSMKGQSIYVYKVTIAATAGSTDVVAGTSGKDNTPLFPTAGTTTIGDSGKSVVLKYSEEKGTPHKYNLGDGDKYKATSLAELYNMTPDNW